MRLPEEREATLEHVGEFGDASAARASAQGTGNSFRLPSPTGVNLAACAEVLLVHQRLVGKCLLAFLAAGWLALVVWPRTFESEAKMLIRVGRESVSLDPTATTSQTLTLQKTQEEEVNSALEVLASRELAEQVVERLGEPAILAGVLPSEGGSPSRLAGAISWGKRTARRVVDFLISGTGVRDPISDHEVAVRRIASQVTIHAPKKSAVITIHAESKTPGMAQAIARTVTEEFLAQHLKVTHTEGSQDFFEQQSREAEVKLNELVNRRTRFLQEREIVSVEANRSMLRDELGAIDRDIILANGELEQAHAEIRDLLEKVAHAEEEVVGVKEELSDTTWSGMRQRVYELELEERSLAASYTAGHPKLRQTREQLADARRILEELQKDRVNQSRIPNPLKRRMEDDLQKAQTRIAGLRSMVDEKEKQRAETHHQNEQLHEFELQLTQMDRQISLLETSLHVLREKQEEARVIDELQAKQISNVSNFQRATFVERPVSPKKRIVAGAMAMCGLLTGVGLAFWREASSPALRTVEHVESQLGHSVISRIPLVPKLEASVRRADAAQSNPLRSRCEAMIAEVLHPLAHGHARGRTLGVMGIDPGCGASTIAAELAIASSESCGLKTILIDADTRGHYVSRNFGLNGAPGLAELVLGDAGHDECVQGFGTTKLELVSSCAAGSNRRIPADPREVLAALAPIRKDVDLVIVDLPPASMPDAVVALAAHLDQLLIVVESEKTHVAQAEKILRRLAQSNTAVVGVVLNKTRESWPPWFGQIVGTRTA